MRSNDPNTNASARWICSYVNIRFNGPHSICVVAILRRIPPNARAVNVVEEAGASRCGREIDKVNYNDSVSDSREKSLVKVLPNGRIDQEGSI